MWNNNQYSNNPPPPQWGGNPPPPTDRGYPGAQAHAQQNNGYPGQQYHQPQYQQQQHYAPPPPQQHYQQNNGYGGGQGYNGGQGYGGGGAHQTGHGYAQQGGFQQAPPPPQHYQATGAGYAPPQHQNQYNQQPQGGMPMRPPTQTQHYGPQFQGQGGASQQPFFQYSQCTGKRKALLIGINYAGTSSALRGCINDVHNVQKFLMERHNYQADDMVVLTDDSRNPRQVPTRANMLNAMRWLVQGAKPNDALFFHYSGHGGQTKDTDGDEDDGNDEVVYPVDFKQAGHIADDEMHAIMVRPLPAGCRLTAIFDSCHSATALDLPYVYSTEGKIKEPNLLAEAGSGVLSAGMSYLRGDVGGMMKGLMGVGKGLMGSNSGATQVTRQTRTSPADVIMWSGCKDSQTSADTSEAGKATGAMSYAFIAALSRNPQQSYVQLLRSIRDELAGKYDQKPQLSSSHPMDTNLLFIC